MAVSVKRNRYHAMGGLRAVEVDIEIDAEDYTEGGIPLTATDFGLGKVINVPTVSSGGILFQYDYENESLVAYWGEYTEEADGPLAEVPEETEISVTLKLIVFGL